MKNILFLILLISFSSVSAQEEPVVNEYSSILSVGEELIFGNKGLRFKEVLVDSRCPKDVTCVWAGEAKVLVEVYNRGELLEEKIITIGSSEIPLNFSEEGIAYSLAGLVLSPYPDTRKSNAEVNYSLNLMVLEKL